MLIHPVLRNDVFAKSCGSIIAIMLGRLGMSVNACIRAYRSLAEKAFTPKHWISLPSSPKGNYSATALEDAIKHVIREQCQEKECLAQRQKDPAKVLSCTHSEKLFRAGNCCKTYVANDKFPSHEFR